jgi:hypothetical protein
MRTVLAIAAVLTLSACAGTKQAVPEQRDVQFEVGKTTLKQVIKELGEPNESKRHANGSHSVQYFYTETLVNSRTSVPFIGSFHPSNEVVSSFVALQFSKDGVLTHYSAISSKATSSNTNSPPAAHALR